MANKNFETGEKYTLADLFSGERRIIIPDLQRDYCWGDNTNRKSSGEIGELVSDFVNNLIKLYDESKEQDKLNLGLFYGYEIPVNHIQLCDGQQRLTTLFLLLGMLNKMSGKFQKHLISDYEYEQDDKEPYLNYAIRETSIYFLSDLVFHFFISNTDKVAKIKEADWYFSDYDLDPSIQSMINALSKIETLLSSKNQEWAASFGDWVLNKLTFIYVDMQNRKNGEETYVVINTTGEPLSTTQNLKPLVIQETNESFDNARFSAKGENGENLAIDKCWEQVETWFWQRRKGDNDTADAGFAEFLRWVYMIEQHKVELPENEQTGNEKYLIQKILQGKSSIEFPYNKIPFSRIYGYWKSIVWIYEMRGKLELEGFKDEYLSPANNGSVNNRNAIVQNDCFVLLPVLKYVNEQINISETSDLEKRNCKRIYEFFNNLIRSGNVKRAVNTLVGEALKIIDLIGDEDIVSVLDKPEVSKQILTEEERCKLEIFRNSPDREDVENEFWKLQSHPLWNGEILPMIKMAQNDGQFDFDKFMEYSKVFYVLFPFGNDNKNPLGHEAMANLLRRCMIVSAQSYEPVSLGRYRTFAWEWNDWKTILSRCMNESSEFFDYVRDNINPNNIENRPIEDVLKDYISHYIDLKKNYSEFAVDGYLLDFTHNSSACDMEWGLHDWQICTAGSRARHTSVFSRHNAYILKEYGATWQNDKPQNKSALGNSGWGVWYWCDNCRFNCVVFEYNNKLKLDVRFLSDSNVCEIVLKSLEKNHDITPMAESLGFTMEKNSTSDATKIHSMDRFDASEIKSVVDSIMKDITVFLS